MDYELTGKWARGIAFIVALLVGASYAMHLHTTSGSIVTALGFGLLFTIVLAGMWHLLLWATQTTRLVSTRVMLLVAGAVLTVGAIVISGRAVTTMIGGDAALSASQAAVLPELEDALAQAYANVSGQDAIVGQVMLAATSTSQLAREEGKSGQGPFYRSLLDSEQMYHTKATVLGETLATGVGFYKAGGNALGSARANIGNEVLFDLAVADAQNAIRSLNAIDLAPSVLKTGTVTSASGGVTPRLDAVTRSLHANVTRLRPEPVPVPTYSPLTATGSIGLNEATFGYWFTSAFIESIPLMLMGLLMFLWREPLHRNFGTRHTTTADEVLTREGNVMGIRKAAE